MFLTLHRKIKLNTELALLAFIFTLSMAIYISYTALFLTEVFSFSKSQVGLFALYIRALTILFSFLVTYIVEKYDDNKILLVSLFGLIIFYTLIGMNTLIPLLFILFFIMTFFRILRFDTFNIIYKDSSKNVKLSKSEGILFTFINMGWFLGPFIAGLFVSLFPVNYIFYLASFFTAIGLMLYINLKIPSEHPARVLKHKKEILYNIKGFFQNSKYKKVFPIAFIYHVWWSFIFTFMTVLIVENGFSSSMSGIFVSFCFVTVMLNEVTASRLKDKLSYSTLFSIGYAIPVVMALGAFFVDSFLLKIIFLIIGSLGYSFIEPIREIYFFENTPSKEDEEKYYPIFTTCYPIGLMLGSGIFSLFYALPIPENFVFLLIATIMAIPFISIYQINQ